MASKTLGSLIVDLEMQTAKFDKRLASIDGRIKNFEKKTNKSIATVKKAFGGLIAFEAVRRATVGILQIADRMTELQGRVKNATRDTGDFNTVWKQLGSIAAETGTELDTTVQVFQRLVLARKELQTTNADMLQFTKTVQQLGVISGASTGALRAGLTQLAQGLSAGTLRAEEFNSIVENIPAVAKAIADGMNLSVGQLRNMVLEGKVLSTDVLSAILSQTGEVNQQMGEMPLTIARATTQLNLAWSQFIVQLDESIDGSSRLAKIIQGITLVLKDWSVEANSFNEKIGFIKRQINELRSQPELIRNLFGTNEHIEELERQLHVLTRGQLPDLVREGKEAGRILTEMGDAAGDAAGQMDQKNKSLTVQEKKALADAKAMEEQAAAAKKLAKEYEILASLTSKTSAFDESVGGKTGGILSADNLDRANDRLKEIQKGVVGIDAATGKLITTQDALNRELEKQAELAKLFEITWTEVMEDTIRSVRGAWSDFFYDVFQGEGIDSFKDFVDRIKDLFLRLIADLAAAWVTRNIFGGLLGIGGGSIFTGGGILGGAAGGGGGGLLGGLLGGAAGTSSGAGGAAVGGVAIAGAAGGAATVFPYVSATGTGVGGAIGGTALTAGGATVTSGAGGATAAGAGAFSGAAAALPYVGIAALAFSILSSGGKNIDDLLRGKTDYSIFQPQGGGATYN
ncbi:MAG: tape measure protein, partial [Gammaproteobacteria bacterium]|nr:tape measure protein [Gammaproteobacteria bacterium]